jgi:hypothetical protein
MIVASLATGQFLDGGWKILFISPGLLLAGMLFALVRKWLKRTIEADARARDVPIWDRER